MATFWTAAFVFIGCFAGAALGTSLRFPQLGNAVLFMPYAVLTSALLLSPPRSWPVYLLAASLGNFWPHHADGASVSFVLMTEVANHARALVAACGIRLFGDARGRFDSLRGMSVFLFFAAVLGPLAGAFIGAGAVFLHGRSDSYWSTWLAWLTSNTLTGLTLLPVILISVTRADARAGAPRWRHMLEAAVLVLALLLVGGVVLLERRGSSSHLLELVYALTPLLLWAAVRFGPRGISASLLIIASLAICGAFDGRGPFIASSAAGIVDLQVFLFATSVPLLLLSALLQEQRRTSRALEESRRRYRMVVDDQAAIICRFGPDGTLTFANLACCRTAQRERSRLLGTCFWSLFPTEERGKLLDIVGGLSPQRPAAIWEGERKTEGGEWIWEQWKVRANFADDHAVDYQAVGIDITERRRGEEDRRLLEAERLLAEALRETDRRKDEFLSMIAHELHNPLAAIGMVIETMRLRPSGDEQARWARELIGGQVAQLKRLVDDLLDISRISSGKIQAQMDAIDLAEVIAIAMETSRPLVVANSVEFVTDVPRAPFPIRGDAARLIQLISNLLDNAAKYAAGGSIRLAVVQDGADVVMRFSDTGVGIPDYMLDRVFEPFTQVDRARDGALGGLGLGLTLVKQLTEMHGGTVQAYSDGPGRGSEFVVRIPVRGRGEESISEGTPPPQSAEREQTIERDAISAIAS